MLAERGCVTAVTPLTMHGFNGPVHGGVAAAGVRCVNEIVVNQRARLDELKRTHRPQHCIWFFTTRAKPATSNEPRPPVDWANSLTPAKDEAFELFNGITERGT